MIDDEEDILHIASYVLKGICGHEVFFLKEPGKALETAKQVTPDVILMDYWLEECTGEEILKILQKDPATSAIPVIFFTGKNEPEDIKHFLALGARGVILKPFDPLTLCHQVEQFLQKS